MKRILALMLAVCMLLGVLTGCAQKEEPKPVDPAPTPVDPTPQKTQEEIDKEAADAVAALIDAIYVQERTDKTDEQCAAAKAAWDALTPAQKELVEGEEADPDYFGRDTGNAKLDDTRNQDNIGEKEILVVSFGTSFNDSRVADIKGVEDALAKAFPDWSVRRAFTAQIIINHIQAREGMKIDNMQQALDRAVANGVKQLVVQPTHLMHGAEYDEMVEAIDAYKDKIEKIVVAEPMLGPVGKDATVINADKQTVAKAVVDAALKDAGFASIKAAKDAKTAFVLMGHGTAHNAKVTYSQMQTMMNKLGYNNVFIGTVEGEPESTACENVIEAVKAAGYTNVILRPLMVVAGDHANNDMAGEDEDSWKSMFEASKAFEKIDAQIAGLGSIPAVQQIYIDHTKAAVKTLTPAAAPTQAQIDKAAAAKVAALIDAIYVQERTDKTDAQCAAAKAAWDKLTDAQKELVEGEEADPDYFGRDTGDAKLDNPRNQDNIGDKEILVVSFGTSFNDSRVKDIKSIEDAIAAANPDWSVRRAFTAQIIINHIQARDGEKIDNMQQALDRAVANGVKQLVVQPTHLMHGAEYDEMIEAINEYADQIDFITVAEPMLGPVGSDATVINADKQAVAKAVVAAALKDAGYADIAAAKADKTAFVLMGHGTAHNAKVTYSQMQTMMNQLGYTNVFIGTVEGEPESTACENVIKAVKAAGYDKVILRPLMVVAGDHANNDMAGEDEDSWKSMFEDSKAFDKVDAQIAGLGRIPEVLDLYKAHTKDAVDQITETVANTSQADLDKKAADKVAALIDAIYVQERTADTDAQCAAAKAAWDKLTDAQKELVEGEEADPDYFGRDTGNAALDNARNQNNIGKKEILVVSFGTSFNDSRVKDIKSIEDAIAKAFPDWSVRRAFTAQIIINHVQARDGEKIDNMKQALDRAVANGVQTLVVQPTHLMHGAEYDEMVEALNAYKSKIKTIVVAEPMLGPVGKDATVINADKQTVAKAVVDAALKDAGFASIDAAKAAKTAFVLMGHGTAHNAKITYSQMQTMMNQLGYTNVFIGTVEGEPESTACENVIKAVKAAGYDKVILRPLMVVAGDHANNDMAGEDEDSWKSMFEVSGYFTKVDAQIAGLGRIPAVLDLYVAHTKDAVDAANKAATPETKPETKPADGTLADGTYNATFKTDSSMFRANSDVANPCTVTVKNGKMTVYVILSGTGFDAVYKGSKEDAQKAGAAIVETVVRDVKCTDGSTDSFGTFTFSIDKLGEDFNLATRGKKSGNWNDHVVSVSINK